MPVDALRTSDARFHNLINWPYVPNYVADLPGYDGLRMHYIDTGPKDAQVTFLCLHGNPSWSYLFRFMIPVFTDAGHRVVAPDMFGFGRSDKPVNEDTHYYHFHRDSLTAFLDQMDLKNVCLVCQDWGGLFGLTLPMDYPDVFTRMIVMNTGLPVGTGTPSGFAAWQAYSNSQYDLQLAPLFQRAKSDLSDEEAAAYDAPFPDASYKAAIRRFPNLVMNEPGMAGIDTSKQALTFLSEQWSGDSFMVIGAQDPVMTPEMMLHLRSVIRNCPEPLVVKEAGHFVQEWGGPIARKALKHFNLV